MSDSESNNPAHNGDDENKKEQITSSNRNFIVKTLEIGPLALAGYALSCLHGVWQLWDFFLVIVLVALILDYETNVHMPAWAMRTRVISSCLLMLIFGWFAFLTGRETAPISSGLALKSGVISKPSQPEAPAFMTTQAAQGEVNAPNNSGNINTGQVGGNLT